MPKFRGDMTLFASAFANPMKIRARLFLLIQISQLNVLQFVYVLFARFIFEGHVKVALSHSSD